MTCCGIGDSADTDLLLTGEINSLNHNQNKSSQFEIVSVPYVFHLVISFRTPDGRCLYLDRWIGRRDGGLFVKEIATTNTYGLLAVYIKFMPM
jgi:hypothetical protein